MPVSVQCPNSPHLLWDLVTETDAWSTCPNIYYKLSGYSTPLQICILYIFTNLPDELYGARPVLLTFVSFKSSQPPHGLCQQVLGKGTVLCQLALNPGPHCDEMYPMHQPRPFAKSELHCLSQIKPLIVNQEGFVPCYQPVRWCIGPESGETHCLKVFVDGFHPHCHPCLFHRACTAAPSAVLIAPKNIPRVMSTSFLVSCLGAVFTILFPCIPMWALNQWNSICHPANFSWTITIIGSCLSSLASAISADLLLLDLVNTSALFSLLQTKSIHQISIIKFWTKSFFFVLLKLESHPHTKSKLLQFKIYVQLQSKIFY